MLDPANQTLPGQPSGNTGNISAGDAIKVSDATKYVMIVLNPTPALEKTLKTATSFAELKDKALSGRHGRRGGQGRIPDDQPGCVRRDQCGRRAH